ncbi:hypothetical protein CAPTEDRAFT_221996 [Capitella teleta]|uniref:Uncharacterized protein n=1 Tax=Capitella teleta TaxID=283909 RepID=R7UP73_CAPTE|nr:hypothetical protein CAPTEDRAFT_221996 [Capitella teleta]|eukprot:ELU08324.1 hypothetical protein CAPTEDRAFT_221996 [Capitella teleta]
MSTNKVNQQLTAKTLGECLLLAALLADDIKDLYDLVKQGTDSHEYYFAAFVTLILSTVLQITSISLGVVLLVMRNQTPVCDADIESADVTAVKSSVAKQRIDTALTAVTILIAVLHIMRNSIDGNENLPEDTVTPYCATSFANNGTES